MTTPISQLVEQTSTASSSALAAQRAFQIAAQEYRWADAEALRLQAVANYEVSLDAFAAACRGVEELLNGAR